MHRPIVPLQRCFPHAEGLCFLLLTGARLSTGQNGEQIIAQQRLCQEPPEAEGSCGAHFEDPLPVDLCVHKAWCVSVG